MSKFIKGTSILGVLAIGIGVWQLVELEEEGDMSTNRIQSVEQKKGTYESVVIEKTDAVAVIPEADMRDGLDTQSLKSIQESVEGKDKIKQLITGLGQAVNEDLQNHEVDTAKEWEALEKDSKEKQKMLHKLINLTNDEDLKKLALTAENNLEKTLADRSLDFYREAVNAFKSLDDQL